MDGGMMTMHMHQPNLGQPPRFLSNLRMQGPPPHVQQNQPREPMPRQPAYISQVRQQLMANQGMLFDGKRMRKAIHRKTVDYNTSVIKYLENRVWQRDYRDVRAVQPDALYQVDYVPPSSMLHNPMNCVTTKFVRTSTNKFRCPIFVLTWTPEGRRLVTGASSGEFTLWNGLTFNFETILQAHDTSVRAMRWTHNDLWMVTADHAGYIKYWQSNMNNVKMYQGHKEPVRGISFCPTDSKFTTCSDDGTVRVWDFLRCHEERILRGHGADVKCVDWHPHKGLIASGSKDNQQPVKLWEPKSGNSLATIHAHKHTVMDLKWNKNGNWLLTASRDHLLKLFDIRNMKEELQTFKGHKKEATAISWHPIHEELFVSGGSDGAIMFWVVGCDREVGGMEEAHEGMVWSLAWHPLGHILASGSNDHTTKFWTRNRLGDRMRDRYNLNNLPAGIEQELLEYDQEPQMMPSLPGMGLEHGLPEHLRQKEKKDNDMDLPAIPGLDWSSDEQFFRQQEQQNIPRKKVPYARPIPKSFEQAWMENKQSGVIAPEEMKKNEKGDENAQPVQPDSKLPGSGPPSGPLQIPTGPPGAITGPVPIPGTQASLVGASLFPMPGINQLMQQGQFPGAMFFGGQQQGLLNPRMQRPPGFPPGQFPGPRPEGISTPGNQPQGQNQPPPRMLTPRPGFQAMPTRPQQQGLAWGQNQQGGQRMPQRPFNKQVPQGTQSQGAPRLPNPGQDQGPGHSQTDNSKGPRPGFGQQYMNNNQEETMGDIDLRQQGSWNHGHEDLSYDANSDQQDDGMGDTDYRQMSSGQSEMSYSQRGRGGMPRGGRPPSARGQHRSRGSHHSYSGNDWEDQDLRQSNSSQYGMDDGNQSYMSTSQDNSRRYLDIDERVTTGVSEDIDERFQRGRGRPIMGRGSRGRGDQMHGGGDMSRGHRGARFNGPARGGYGNQNQAEHSQQGGWRGSDTGDQMASYYEGGQDTPGQQRKRTWEEGPGRRGRGRGGMGRGNPPDLREPKYGYSSEGWHGQDQEETPYSSGRGGGYRGGSRGGPRGRGDFRGRGEYRGRGGFRGRGSFQGQ